MALIVTLVPGAPERLTTDCPACGWADVWQVILHTISPRGVGDAAILRHCQRCGDRTRA